MTYTSLYDGIVVITNSVEQSETVAMVCSTRFPFRVRLHHCCKPVILDARDLTITAFVVLFVNLCAGLPKMPLLIAHPISQTQKFSIQELLQKPDAVFER
jgi:hypothetical protein